MRKSLLKISGWAVGIAVLAVVAYFGYRHFSQKPKTADKAEERVIPVRTITASRGTIRQEVLLTGELQACRTVDVFSKVTGRLERLRLEDGTPVEEGTYVHSGDVIAVVDHESLAARVAQAEAAVVVAQAAEQQADANFRDAKRELERFENLFKQGAATEQQRDQQATRYELAEAEKTLAEAQTAEAEANLRAAEVDLAEAIMVAPMNAIVSMKYIDEGNMVTLTAPIVQLVEAQEGGGARGGVIKVKVMVQVPPRWLRNIEPGVTPVSVRVDEHPEKDFGGTVAKIYPTTDPQTRMSKVEISVNSPAGRLRPGMFARVKLTTEERKDAIAIPRDAILQINSNPSVLVVEEGRARKVDIKVGLMQAAQVEVLEGLKGNEEIITTGAQFVTEGGKVKVVEEGTEE